MRIGIEALLFDLDGTLIDSKNDLVFSVQQLQKNLGFKPNSEEEITGFIGDGVVRLVERALPGCRGKKLTEAVEWFKRYYRIHCLDQTRLYPRVRETLFHFRDKKLVVVTNKPVRISRRILESLGVAPRFRFIYGGDSFKNKKPHPESIQFVLRKMGISDPRRAVMVGDGVNDVLAGQGAGTLTCGILSGIGNPRALRASRPDFLLLNTAELMHIFN